MRVVELSGDDELTTLYRDVFVPSFPPGELESLSSLRAAVRDGRTRVSAAIDQRGVVVAGAAAEWSPACRVLLLSYLAVVHGGRGTSIGGALYRHVLDQWTAEYEPCLFVAEVEHPDFHTGSTAHGDPLRRLRFYGKHHARVLRLPYFQPALREDAERIYGVLLLALHVDAKFAGPVPHSIAGAPLATWMTEYLVETEGGVRTDAVTTALMDALVAAGGVQLLDTEQYREVPVAAPLPATAGGSGSDDLQAHRRPGVAARSAHDQK
jgi:hypothetical protein